MAGEGEKRNVCRVLVGRPEGKRPVGRPSVERMVTLKHSTKQDDDRAWIELIWLREWTCDEDQKFHPKPVKIKAHRLL